MYNNTSFLLRDIPFYEFKKFYYFQCSNYVSCVPLLFLFHVVFRGNKRCIAVFKIFDARNTIRTWRSDNDP